MTEFFEVVGARKAVKQPLDELAIEGGLKRSELMHTAFLGVAKGTVRDHWVGLRGSPGKNPIYHLALYYYLRIQELEAKLSELNR